MKIEIKILGMGCPKCQKLYEAVQSAVKEMNMDAEITKITQINDIVNYGVMITPALVIDGKVKIVGKVPSVDEIKKFIEGANV